MGFAVEAHQSIADVRESGGQVGSFLRSSDVQKYALIVVCSPWAIECITLFSSTRLMDCRSAILSWSRTWCCYLYVHVYILI